MRSVKTPKSLTYWILIAGAIAAAGGYLFASSRVEGPGFPLDDAWIHLTYARNLGQAGEWAFVPGKPSAGSTAPLWTGLLALGYVLRLAPFIWPYALGTLSLAGLAISGERFYRRETGENGWLPWAGLFLLGEYHLVWAAVSGMETVLMGLLYLFALGRMSGERPRWGWLGGLIGLAVWVRPDGITLLGPAFFILLFSRNPWRARLGGGLRLAGGLALLFLPYLLFNLQFQGSLWPNTFYAKQSEYLALQQRFIGLRLLDELALPLIGAGLLLAPGFLYHFWHAWARKRSGGLAAALWFVGYAALYAWRLPVTYQYGRYLIPAMPVYFVLGLVGTAGLLAEIRSQRGRRLARFSAALLVGGLLMGFYVLGARNYARDVAVIESEMVATARWLAANTAPGDLIAVHDIGAVGYFAERDIIDLAGLVTPEVIPFLRDEARLAAYLDERGAAALVVFPTWYATLPRGHEILYASAGKYAPAAGGENLTVYRWK